MPTAGPGDVTLHYQAHGPADAIPIVLLHGLGSSAADWAFQVPALARRYRVLAPDLRGHGRSPRLRGRVTVDAMARDVAALLAALDAPPAHVVGLSLGGCVAQALALDQPARVRSLVLVNTFARPASAGPRSTLRLVTRLGLLTCAPMRTVAAHVARGLFPRADQRELYLAAVASLSSNPRGTYFASLRALAGFDVRRRLRALRCPTLVIAGDRDRTVPLAAKRLLHGSIADAELLVVGDSGHATPYDQAERFNAALLAYLDAH